MLKPYCDYMFARILRLNEFAFYFVGLAVYFLNIQYIYIPFWSHVRNSQISVFLLARACVMRAALGQNFTSGQMVPHDPMT